MTKEKWTQIVNTCISNSESKTILLPDLLHSPESWPKYKGSLEVFIKELDEAYNVYNMENERK